MLLCKAHTHCLLLSLFKQTLQPEELEDIPKDVLDNSAAFKNTASSSFPLPFKNTFFQWYFRIIDTNGYWKQIWFLFCFTAYNLPKSNTLIICSKATMTAKDQLLITQSAKKNPHHYDIKQILQTQNKRSEIFLSC